MPVWEFIQLKLTDDHGVVLLCVLDSHGSSPGRQGFKMAVSADGDITGSIGGGIMEHKWVEKARDMLQKKERKIIVKEQVHSKESLENQSGMICSGRQTIALVPLNSDHVEDISKLMRAGHAVESGTLVLHPGGLKYLEHTGQIDPFHFSFTGPGNWEYREVPGYHPVLHIIGGGHVSLAFSKLMATLDFKIIVYDDRAGLNTLEQNVHASERLIVDYEKIGDFIKGNPRHYVVIMTFGYRSDKLVLRQLLNKPFRYLGMLGSEAKIAQLYREYEKEGITRDQLAHVYAPVGLPIYSKTPAEIAISIAGEIIRVKNEGLATGRS